MKIRSVSITDFKVFKDFEIDFTSDGQVLNLVVIAGENGSGKTTLLTSLIGEARRKDPPAEHIQIDWEDRDRGVFLYFPINDLPISGTKQVLVEYIDKLIYEKDLKSSEALQQTQNLLDHIFDGFHMHVHLGGVASSREVYFLGSGNERIPIEDLSRGEQQMIVKAFSLYLSDVRNSVILIDEPESSLHPSWQNRIATVFQRFADSHDNQIILSTHSPQIVSAVRRDQVRVLVRDEGEIRVISDFSGSYGWRIDKILLEIMGARHLRVPEVEEELDRLNELVEANECHTPEFRERMSRMEDLLGYADHDLMLLRLEMEQRCAEEDES